MGEGLFQPLHILLIIGIALLLFGPSKFADLGKGPVKASAISSRR